MIENHHSNNNINIGGYKLTKNKANKSFKGIIPNSFNIYSNVNANNTKSNNKELLKKLNEKYNNYNNISNNNYQKSNSNEINNNIYKEQDYSNNKSTEIQQFEKFKNSYNQQNLKPKGKKSYNNIIKKSNSNDFEYDNIKNNNFLSNEDKTDTEYKISEKIKQLYLLNNIKEKLKIFQYFFNSFNEILTNINQITAVTLRQFVDIHIEYIIFEDKFLTEQIIKNLMRMIFYMPQIFSSNDIRLIVKILMIKINLGEKSISKLSYGLLDLIRKEWKVEDIYYGIFDLLEDKKINCYDICYEYLTLLVVYCGNVLEDINYFRKMIELICDSGSNSTNVGKLIEALYKNNRNYFMTTIKELNQEKQKKILLFLDNNNSNTNNNCNDKNMNSNVSNNSSGKIKRIVNKSSNNNNFTDNNSSPYDGIKIYIYNGNIKAFIEILENNKNYMPNCFMLLTEEKNIKFIGNLLNFIFTIIALKTNLCKEINQNMEILISQLVKCFLHHRELIVINIIK